MSCMTIGLVLTSCSDDDDTIFLSDESYENGILISHEGNGTVSGSVSFISNDLGDSQGDIYNKVNKENLGIYQQSIGFKDNLAFIVVDNANSITVVNRKTFEKVGSITTGLKTPRYITFFNNKGYVTNWGDTLSETDDFIAIVNLENYTVEATTIPVSEGPEQIVEKNGILYVSHKGGLGTNNIVTLINGMDNTTEELEVGDTPDEMIFDEAGNLWVLSEGITVYGEGGAVLDQTPGALVKINTTTNEVETTINFTGTDQPTLMAYEGGVIYYHMDSKVYAMSETSTTLPDTAIVEGSFYGMAVQNNILYTVDAKNFASEGTLKIFDLSNNEETNSFSVGVVPSKIYFN